MGIRLKGQTAIITGGARGQGAAEARRFADEGAFVVITDLLDREGEDLATEIGSAATFKHLDVTNQEAWDELIRNILDERGSIDVLVNNAGMHSRGNLEAVSPEDVGAMVDVNIRAPLMLSCAAIPFMRRAGGGGIVMVGSLAGMAPLQGAATYSGTKAGLRAFAYALADEMRGTGIHVGVVSPGPIDTGFIMDEIDLVEDIVFSQPMSTAKQVADAIIELAAEDTVEISMPAFSGKLTTLSYLFPSLRRLSRGTLNKIGRKNKEKYRARNKGG